MWPSANGDGAAWFLHASTDVVSKHRRTPNSMYDVSTTSLPPDRAGDGLPSGPRNDCYKNSRAGLQDGFRRNCRANSRADMSHGLRAGDATHSLSSLPTGRGKMHAPRSGADLSNRNGKQDLPCSLYGLPPRAIYGNSSCCSLCGSRRAGSLHSNGDSLCATSGGLRGL